MENVREEKTTKCAIILEVRESTKMAKAQVWIDALKSCPDRDIVSITFEIDHDRIKSKMNKDAPE